MSHRWAPAVRRVGHASNAAAAQRACNTKRVLAQVQGEVALESLVSGLLPHHDQKSSPAGNRTRVTRVTGGYTNLYTTEDDALLLALRASTSALILPLAIAQEAWQCTCQVPSQPATSPDSSAATRLAFVKPAKQTQTFADGRTRTCAGRAQWISGPPP